MQRSFLLSCLIVLVSGLTECAIGVENSRVRTAAEQVQMYLPQLENKRVAIVANQTSVIGDTHLVDSLLSLNINIQKIFSPEHGFRGQKDAGETFADGIDIRTGIPLISLYGRDKKPKAEDLQGVDVVVFDIQDVGVRFYTYLSTLHYVMEACAEQSIPLLVLDRPNPNGFYIDGPVLDSAYKSFIGLHPVPIVYGMTIGEYALMINGEHWHAAPEKCDLSIIPLKNYTHDSLYQLPVHPSPNLQTMQSIYLYPSLALFEGTVVSVGRGTSHPFTCFGHPLLSARSFSFIPRSIPGASKNPKLKGERCFGEDFSHFDFASFYARPGIQLQWILDSYEELEEQTEFFRPFFYQLSGTKELRRQIEQGVSQEKIRDSWREEINEFKYIRRKYLLYD